MLLDHDEDIQMLADKLEQIHENGLPSYPLIVFFYSGDGNPSNCIEMARDPNPSTGQPFDKNLGDYVSNALSINPAVHDGAICFARATKLHNYTLKGWSYRITAAYLINNPDKNRGSAYNSAVSMSVSEGVVCVCLFLEGEYEMFVNGERIQL